MAKCKGQETRQKMFGNEKREGKAMKGISFVEDIAKDFGGFGGTFVQEVEELKGKQAFGHRRKGYMKGGHYNKRENKWKDWKESEIS